MGARKAMASSGKGCGFRVWGDRMKGSFPDHRAASFSHAFMAAILLSMVAINPADRDRMKSAKERGVTSSHSVNRGCSI
jgi:hypothetical protein